MAEGLLAVDPTDAALVASIPTTGEMRKQKLGEMLKVKLEQGYRIECQDDSEVILFTKGHRSWFGLVGSGEGARLAISVDEQGAVKTRKLSTGEAIASDEDKSL